MPSLVHSASLHPSRSVFVCGGEDFKMYKMDYTTGQELESFKGNYCSNIIQSTLNVINDNLSYKINIDNIPMTYYSETNWFSECIRTLWTSALCTFFAGRRTLRFRIRRWNITIVADCCRKNVRPMEMLRFECFRYFFPNQNWRGSSLSQILT